MNPSPAYDGNPADHPRDFRRCLGQFATGVTVVTAEVWGELIGMTANSFSSVSLDPPLILWSVDRASTRFAQFAAAEHFVINVLADRQIPLSRHFAASGPDKFRDVAWFPGQNGAPVLNDTAAFFECRKAGECDGGDHLILIGKVERAVLFERGVLLFSQGRYRVPADHPDDTIRQTATAGEVSTPAIGSLVLSDLFRANHKLSFEFSRYRAGMTRDQHRVLIGIERRPGIEFDALAKDTFLGVQAAEDAVNALIADGSITADAEGRYDLTPAGRERRRALVVKLLEMEKELLKDIPADVVQAGGQLLAHLAGD